MRTPDQIGVQEQEPTRLYDFFNLTEVQELALKEAVARSNGVIRIFVHPYFKSDERPIQSIWNKGTPETMRAEMEALLQSETPSMPPIMLFEEEARVNELKLKMASSAKKDIYIVPTEANDPSPRAGSQASTSESQEGENWKIFREKLSGIGVTKIIVGGMHLALREYPRGDSNDIFGCVGITVNNLSKEGGFQVDISNLSFPDAREFKRVRRGKVIKKEGHFEDRGRPYD